MEQRALVDKVFTEMQAYLNDENRCWDDEKEYAHLYDVLLPSWYDRLLFAVQCDDSVTVLTDARRRREMRAILARFLAGLGAIGAYVTLALAGVSLWFLWPFLAVMVWAIHALLVVRPRERA